MRKGVKGCLITAAVFAAVGIGMTAGGAAMGAGKEGIAVIQEIENKYGDGHDFDLDWDEDYVMEYDIDDDLDSELERKLEVMEDHLENELEERLERDSD